MKRLKRLLILSHRYVGIPLSVIFIVWFGSGIVMMYAGGMPTLTAQARLEKLPEVDLAAVTISPLEAAERAGTGANPASARLLTILDRPAYRFTGRGGTVTVFADTGELLSSVGPEGARQIAARFVDGSLERVHYQGALDRPDQWTLTHLRDLPLHKVRVDDGRGTEVYVSPRTAEVVLLTDRGSRALAWMGTIPHWFYVTPLRVNQPLWYWSVVITAGIGCVVAFLGLLLAFTQFRRTRPFRLSKSVPYVGWMRWHYITGALFGFFALTWAFSGILSLQPFPWNNAQPLIVRQDVLSGGPLDMAEFERPDASAWSAIMDGRALKEVELTRIQDEPYFIARHTAPETADGRGDVRREPYIARERRRPDFELISALSGRVREEPFSVESLLQRLRSALPSGVQIVEHELLTEYDAYYYSRAGQQPLPVLRVKFDDPGSTWYYVDPEQSRVMRGMHRLNRLDRWLYQGLHSLDFSFWYARRPLWDIGVILLSLGALATSGIGLYLGVNRIRRGVVRTLRRSRRSVGGIARSDVSGRLPE